MPANSSGTEPAGDLSRLDRFLLLRSHRPGRARRCGIARLGGWRWLCLGWLIIVFEVDAVLVLRAHYTMDVFTGIIAAHYAAILASWSAPWLDQRLVGTLTAKSLPK